MTREALGIAQHIVSSETRGKPFALPRWQQLEPEALEWLSLLAHSVIQLHKQVAKAEQRIETMIHTMEQIQRIFHR